MSEKPQCFAYVQTTYAGKNKLDQALIDALKEYDCTLFVNKATAAKHLDAATSNAIYKYQKEGGKATPKDRSFYQVDAGCFFFSIPEVIVIIVKDVNQVID